MQNNFTLINLINRIRLRKISLGINIPELISLWSWTSNANFTILTLFLHPSHPSSAPLRNQFFVTLHSLPVPLEDYFPYTYISSRFPTLSLALRVIVPAAKSAGERINLPSRARIYSKHYMSRANLAQPRLAGKNRYKGSRSIIREVVRGPCAFLVIAHSATPPPKSPCGISIKIIKRFDAPLCVYLCTYFNALATVA